MGLKQFQLVNLLLDAEEAELGRLMPAAILIDVVKDLVVIFLVTFKEVILPLILSTAHCYNFIVQFGKQFLDVFNTLCLAVRLVLQLLDDGLELSLLAQQLLVFDDGGLFNALDLSKDAIK